LQKFSTEKKISRDAWKKLGSKLSKDDAKKKYLSELEKLNPKWKSEVGNAKAKL
jgi:acyl-CoA-binding protein